MSLTPDVSIIVPVHNDEDFIAAALESCLAQSWQNFEVICVDDASTDATPEVIERFQERDRRIRLLRQDRNRSAFQARRAGILAAQAPYVLFLDGDDELMPAAVQTTLELARSEGADVVGFGVQVVGPEGQTGGKFERTLQPSHGSLEAMQILTELFPVGKTAQGHIWKYLWNVELLRGAYASLSSDLELYRANDLPVTFLSLASAQRYVSTPERMLRYYWRRGTSGHGVKDRASFEFYLAGLTSVDAIRTSVEQMSRSLSEEEARSLLKTYESARLSIIGNLLRYWIGIASNELRSECLLVLAEKAGRTAVIRAAATFCSDALPQLAQHREVITSQHDRSVRSVLLMATDLASGGAQGVVVSQAKYLVEAGFRVVIGVRAEPESVYELPPGVDLVRIWSENLAERIELYLEVCRDYEVDVAIDHWVLYRDDWPYFVLAAGALGVRTIGWIHNFALRPLFDANRRISFLTVYLPLLWKIVTLSETDVAFWKLRGIDQVVYLPNPPSPLLLDRVPRELPRTLTPGPIRLVWWGRLQQATKRLREMIDVAAALRALGIDFRLTIIGPDSRDLSAAKLAALADERGVADAVTLPGPVHGDALRASLEEADLFIGTSAIEGYPLNLVEAQALGLPLAMYELPWLASLVKNRGVVTAPQHDVIGLARQIADLSHDPDRFSELSAASLDAARSVLAHDFRELYAQLLTDLLPSEFSPDATIEHARILLDRAVAYSEQHIYVSRAREIRLNNRIRALNNKVSEMRELHESLSTSNERRAAKVHRQRERIVELTGWTRERQAKIEELEGQLAALQGRLAEHSTETVRAGDDD